jgi:UDP-glucuronate decarboxylase
VDGLIGLMQTDSAITGPVNLGNPDECSIIELAERIVALTGSGSKLVYRPLPADDPVQRRPDITLAGELLDWSPAVQLEEGLAATMDYFRAQVGLQEVGQ